jgi:branched-subunit amino acid aminotransferase/4-amino-4-deoxychorismate lyase
MTLLDGLPAAPESLAALGLANYGHYTSMRAESGHIRGLSQHLDRLVVDCRSMFAVELDRDRVRAYIRRAISSTSGAAMVRVTVFDPGLELHRPAAPAHPQILVTTCQAEPAPQPAMRVLTVHHQRDLPHVKHVGLLDTLWNRRRAQQDGFDDALFLDDASLITEGPTWNIGFFDGDQVIWPRASALTGVTMRLLQQVHENTTVSCVTLQDAIAMQAVFTTNATHGVRSVSGIDDACWPQEHPIVQQLRAEYEEIPAERV